MANKLIEEPLIEKSTKKQFKLKLPKMEGKFGFSIYIGNKEVFIGIMTAEVVLERVIRSRKVKVAPSGVKVLKWD